MNEFNKWYCFTLDKLVALVFALIPFTSHYIVPGVGSNLAFASSVCIVFLYYFYRKIPYYRDNPACISVSIAVPILVTMLCYCTLHQLLRPPKAVFTTTPSLAGIIFHFIIMYVCILVFAHDKVRLHYFRYVEIIAVIMTFVVIAQYMIYFGLGTTITTDRSFLFPFKAFFTSGMTETLKGSKMIIGGLFRPSAFFIEPAHYSQYCLIGLTVSLANNEELLNKKAIIISIGIILTTSGLGIVTTFAIWMVKLVINGKGLTRSTIIYLCVGLLILILAFIALFAVSNSFRMAVARITTGSVDHKSALEGRLGTWILLKDLNAEELLFGMGYGNIPTYGVKRITYYMTGIIELLYCQGILGTSLFLLCYIQMMLKAFRRNALTALYILIVYIPFLIGSANLVLLSLLQYIPLLYLTDIKDSPVIKANTQLFRN